MRYLVTGYKGFIGTNLVRYLQNLNHEVIGVDYPDDLRTKIPGDVGIDVVVHLASETDVRLSLRYPKLFFDSNISTLFSALYVAERNNAKLVFTSSCGAANPTNPYAASKVACEALCKAYIESYGTKITILRLSNVYGPHSGHKTSVIAKFIKNKLSNEPCYIYGSGNQKRDFIHVQDVCNAIVNAEGISNHLVNVSTGRLTSVNDIVRMLDINEVVHSDAICGEVMEPLTERWPGCLINLEQGLASTLSWFLDSKKFLLNEQKVNNEHN